MRAQYVADRLSAENLFLQAPSEAKQIVLQGRPNGEPIPATLDQFIADIEKAKIELLASPRYNGLKDKILNRPAITREDAARSLLRKIDVAFLKFTNGKLRRKEFCQVLSQLDLERMEQNQFRLCYRLEEDGGDEMIASLVWDVSYAPSRPNLDRFITSVSEALKWTERNRAVLALYLESNTKGYRHATADERKAVSKLESEGKNLGSIVLRFRGPVFESGRDLILINSETSKDLMRQALGAFPLEGLPRQIQGFDTGRLFVLIKSWLGDDGLNSFAYKTAAGTLYSLPAINTWALKYRRDLDVILNRKWIPMPVQPSSLWAVQEVSVRSGTGLEQIAVATPAALYINRAFYPQFMDLFRSNEQALTGAKIEEALGEFKTQLSEELRGLRDAVQQAGRINEARLGEISSKLGDLHSVRNAAWTLTFIQLLNLLK